LVLMGELLGAAIVSALGNMDSEVLYGVSARDPVVLGSMAAFLFMVSLGAAFWPAWSAAGSDPKAALRAS